MAEPSRFVATGKLTPKADELLLPLGVTVMSHAASTTVNPSFMRKPSPTVNFAGSPEVHHDLPGGGRRLLQRADGYRHTVVRGVETYADGIDTGDLPGRLIRGPQAVPV